MDIEQRAEMLTVAYIHSYKLALKEVRNPTLAAQIASGVTMVINMGQQRKPEINPVEIFLHMAAAAQKKTGEGKSEVEDLDEENAGEL